MRCIFCKEETQGNEPLEHVLPESLGNDLHTLRRGVVCAQCNNYFASKVEKPFMETPEICALRFHQLVPSKKGRTPVLPAVLQPRDIIIDISRDAKDGSTSICVPDEGARMLLSAAQNRRGCRIVAPAMNLLAPGSVVSRFAAKVAIEALAKRVETNDELLDEIVDHKGLDALRGHARVGHIPNWPVSIRQIYHESSVWKDESCPCYQLVHEFDSLYTEKLELYFVLAIFGQELAINMGGPDLSGWEAWLDANNDASPLHLNRNERGELRIS